MSGVVWYYRRIGTPKNFGPLLQTLNALKPKITRSKFDFMHRYTPKNILLWGIFCKKTNVVIKKSKKLKNDNDEIE